MLGALFTRNLEALKRPAMATNDGEVRVIGTRSQASQSGSTVEVSNGKAKAIKTSAEDSPASVATGDEDAQDSDGSEVEDEEQEEYEDESEDDVDK